MNSKVYKWCAVPQCDNTSIKTPDKLFVFVPQKKTIRDKWLNLARRDPTAILPSTHLYFCEDHFDMPNDMDNYMEYHLMGSVSQIRMKPGCMPTRYQCQSDRIKRTYDATERSYILKKQRTRLIEECEKDLEERTVAAKQVELGETSSGNSGRKIRMGSVQMCDLDSRMSAPRAEGGVPCDPSVPAASHVSGHFQEYTEVPVVVIKMEHDAEEATTTQEASAEYMCLPESTGADFSRVIKEEDDFIIKEEDEADEMMVKQELHIGSMVLQPQAGPRLLSPSTQEDDFIMKTEDEECEMMVKQELEIGPMVLQPQAALRIPSPHTQEDDFLIKAEDEADEMIVKQELEIGRTVQQPQAALRTSSQPTQMALDPRPSTSSGVGRAPTPLGTACPPRKLRTETEYDYYRKGPKVRPDAGLMLESTRAEDGCQKAFKQHSGNEETYIGKHVEYPYRYCIRSLSKQNPKKTGTFTGCKQYECHYYKYITNKKSHFVNHIRKHISQRLHKCEQCEYSSSHAGDLMVHMCTHMGEKLYKCEV